MKRVVILGGGVGGTIVANLLARRLRPEEAEIVLVDKEGRHVYQPGFMQVAFERRDPRRLERGEGRLLNRRVNLIIDEAVHIDPEAREVQLERGEALLYDRLVVALGARLVPEELPGFSDAAHHFYTSDASLKLRRALESFQRGRIVVTVASVPYKCPPAPAEAACQLDYYFTKRGIRDQVDILFLSPLSRVFPLEPINPVVERLFSEHGIRSTIFFNVESVDPAKKVVRSIEGEEAPSDLLIMVPPHRGAKVVEDSGLGDRGGWLRVDKNTLRSKAHAEIFGLGDGTDLPVSKSGAAAHFQAKIVAESLLADLRGTPAASHYDGRVTCYFDAGYHRAMAMAFDYAHPPRPRKPGLRGWIGKRALNRAYWTFVPTGRV
jgi:sulfide:quinone oxidoreductase